MVDSQYQSVLVRADTLELHVEATLVMQEHAGAIAVDRTVREQHTNGECGLHVLRQRQECLVRPAPPAAPEGRGIRAQMPA